MFCAFAGTKIMFLIKNLQKIWWIVLKRCTFVIPVNTSMALFDFYWRL
jgi:hypothetical protein